MAPRVAPHHEVLKFEGRIDYPIEQKVDDWGLGPHEQETYVELFRRRLVAENLWKPDDHDYYTLRRFLRARTYDLDKAMKMFHDHIVWRHEHKVDTILTDFHFTERDSFLEAYPQGYHKLDKQGRPVYIQLIGKINVPAIMSCTDEDRMFQFHVQEYERCVKVIMPVCSKLAKRKIDQTFGIMDVRGVGLSALTGDVKRMLTKFTKTDQDNYPEMLGHICIINAPTIFRMVWSLVKNMIDVRTQQKIEILGSNYMDALVKHIDIDSIPEFLGGKSRGTLLDDVGPWSDLELMRSRGIDLEALGQGHGGQLVPQAVLTPPPFGRPSTEPDTGSYVTTQGSIAHTSSGIPQVHIETINGTLAAPAPAPTLGSVAEVRTRALIQRLRTMEERLRNEGRMVQQHTTVRDTASMRSAPEGSLLNRVDVMEEALEVLLNAQEVLLTQLQHQETELAAIKAEREHSREHDRQRQASRSRESCCTIM